MVRRLLAGVVGAGAVLGVGISFAVLSAGTAFANSQPYELYCPGTPVGNVVLNGVTTTATITPASPAAGQQFNITSYQTNVSLPDALAEAAYAIQPNLEGSASTTVDVTGASPTSMAGPTVQFNQPFQNGGQNGAALALPSSPTTIGPFTATGGAITVTQAENSKLNLVIGGNTMNLSCTSYPNDANVNARGILSSAVQGTPAAPVIATSSSPSTSATSATTPTTAATQATTATTAAAATPLPNTGAGPGLSLMALFGALLVAGAFALVLFDRTRAVLRRALHGGAWRRR